MFDQSATEVRRMVKRAIADLVDSREPVTIAGIVSDLRIINGQRGRVGIFKLDDKTDVIESVANEELLNANKGAAGKGRTHHCPGQGAERPLLRWAARFNVQAVWDLAAARARFGRHVLVRSLGGADKLADPGARVPGARGGDRRRHHPPGPDPAGARACGARRGGWGAQWLMDLGEHSRLWPADEALARLAVLGDAAEVVFDAG